MFFKTTINQKQQKQNSEGKKFSVFCIVKKTTRRLFLNSFVYVCVIHSFSVLCFLLFGPKVFIVVSLSLDKKNNKKNANFFLPTGTKQITDVFFFRLILIFEKKT